MKEGKGEGGAGGGGSVVTGAEVVGSCGVEISDSTILSFRTRHGLG